MRKHIRPNIGDKFSDLTVVSSVSELGKYHIVCKCVCGSTVDVSMYHLLSGNTRSCRCQTSKILSNGKGAASLKYWYNIYKLNALKLQREFKLTLGEFKLLTVNKNCVYCGEPAKLLNRYLNNKGNQKRKNKRYKQSTVDAANIYVNGVDRIDNNVGYIKENCCTCCESCNFMKQNFTAAQFIEKAHKISHYCLTKIRK